jgi:hypothetical protein
MMKGLKKNEWNVDVIYPVSKKSDMLLMCYWNLEM